VLCGDGDEDLLDSAPMLSGEYEFLERNDINLAVDDSRSIAQLCTSSERVSSTHQLQPLQ